MSKLSRIFIFVALVLSHWMVAVTAYNYCDMLWAIEYKGFSAPANVAFFLALPYTAAILICLSMAFVFRRKK